MLNQNAFLYRKGARAGEYLHLAGGMNRDADRGQIFVLRADGCRSWTGSIPITSSWASDSTTSMNWPKTPSVDIYAAPVGDPALGPVAYPHRASAMELPQATLSHHWQDSTHISDDVVTLGISRGKIKVEASGFHGAEPGENRWIIQQGAIDSWSARLWYFPAKNWAAQISGGRITHPEALEPGDQIRLTGSLHYTRPMQGSAWSSSFVWGRNHDTGTLHNLNSYLAESVLPVGSRNFITGRAELVDKDELFSAQPEIQEQLAITAGSTFRVGSYTIGYTRDIPFFDRIETGIGFNFSAYSLPSAIKPYYGDHPVGGNIFIRFRLKSSS